MKAKARAKLLMGFTARYSCKLTGAASRLEGLSQLTDDIVSQTSRFRKGDIPTETTYDFECDPGEECAGNQKYR